MNLSPQSHPICREPVLMEAIFASVSDLPRHLQARIKR